MAGPERRDDVDWLRVGAVYLLLVFHSAKVFDRTPIYHLKNGARSDVLTVFTSAVHQWHMPLLFTLAGWSVTHSLSRRGRRGFLRERRARLLVPFLFGCAVLMPPIGYVQLLHSNAGFHGSFWSFLPTFYTRLDRFTWSQLWFLVYLLVFTLLYVRLFERLLRSDRELERVRASWIYAAIAPLAAVQVGLRWHWPGYQNLYDDWANFFYYSLFFIFGFLLSRFPAIERAAHREWRRAAVVCVAATAALGPALLGHLPASGVNVEYVGAYTLTAVAGLCGVIAWLGFGAHHLRGFARRALPYARDSAMPVYILHQLAIVALATAVITLDTGIALKFTLLLSAATIATFGAYQLLVRHSPPLRLLLGVKGEAPTASTRLARLRRARPARTSRSQSSST